uniref:DNA 5'-3' helicase n=1 Tax=Herposiphonia versicolor TaxID=2007163 RepID=A0A1Z1MFM0_9FLOR|nr:Replication helicase subunit [Herposiphonia versicolor]ARW64850.1 Replication helicase subunit [Herposiphonia versicolor]
MNKLYPYKFIPQNHTIENTLLGIILINPNILDIIGKSIKKEYFFLETNQIIYIHLIEINTKSSNHILELINKLYTQQLLSKIGGIYKITKIMKQGQIYTTSFQRNKYVSTLIQILHDHYIKRLIIQCGYNTIHMGYLKNITSQKIYIKMLSQINYIETEINQKKKHKIANVKDLISNQLIKMKYHSVFLKSKINAIIVESGFQDLDNILQNLQQGNLIIVAGRPSIGKTSFVINIAYNTFFKQHNSLLIFSLEMSRNELFNKIMSIASKTIINQKTIQQLHKEQWMHISYMCQTLINHNIYINDKNNVDIRYINETAKNIKKKTPNINLIVIDYLQLIEINLNKDKKYNRSQELGYITRKLKLLAQFLKIPIITISQLNRNIETRTNKEPLLSDLKESGCIKLNQNINVKSDYTKNINIYNITKNYKKIILKVFNNIKKKQTKPVRHEYDLKYIKGYILLSHEYIFNYIKEKSNIILTHNHRYLSQNVWITCNKILLSTKISRIHNNNKYSIHKDYIHSIYLKYYSKSYDINQNSSFNVIPNNIITHNSIEQDADIILTLFEKENTEICDKIKNNKTVDIKVSKNRNGNTGYCKLLFVPEISLFKNFQQ